MSKIKHIEVYDAGSTVAVDNVIGVVDKAVVGANGAIQYQLIVYVPERHTIVVNDFELTAVEGKTKKVSLGFAVAPKMNDKKEVTVLLTEENQFVGTANSEDIIVNAVVLSADELKEYQDALSISEGEVEGENEKG